MKHKLITNEQKSIDKSKEQTQGVNPVILGDSVESLKPLFADPIQRGDYHQKLIATGLDIPYRVWLGSGSAI